ncbi:MAG: hypothetical protein SF066_09355 [Thermoanaerobaculia bacterium]|nr:hypothetical protein [Thermoanaerobaculia bacterium]
MNVRFCVLLALCVGMPASAAEVAFGVLPAGAASTNVVTDVRAEICRDHLFDPSRAEIRLPKDYRLMLASEYAEQDPSVADLLKSDAKYSAYAVVGSLCFMSVGSFVVDGQSTPSQDPIPMAFWWVRAAGPRDPRMQGKVDWLQLASWYSRNVVGRERILATDPTAQFVDLEVKETEPGLWRMHLVLPTESIQAEVRGSGQRTRRNSPEPGFMSVPFAGEGAGSFWVITYFGHHHQSAQGKWQAEGAGVFSEALRIPGEASVFGTAFQDGWSALSGLYRP